MNVHYLITAQTELDDTFEWYETQQSGLGYKLLDEIDATIHRICFNPYAYPQIAKDVRRALVKRFPYGIIFGYDLSIGTVIIVAIAHLHREPSYWLERL